MKSKEKLLAEARTQFATKGLDRASLSGIAAGVGLTKQALLYHFGTKEKLYGAVLRDIAERHMQITDQMVSSAEDPEAQLRAIFNASFENAIAHPLEAQLLMRELLDNESRARGAHVWYLKPAIETLTDLLLSLPAWQSSERSAALLSIYQLLGAINYFAISQPTLKQMFGVRQVSALNRGFPQQLNLLVRAVLSNKSAEQATT